jgi:hypothetical protein
MQGHKPPDTREHLPLLIISKSTKYELADSSDGDAHGDISTLYREDMSLFSTWPKHARVWTRSPWGERMAWAPCMKVKYKIHPPVNRGYPSPPVPFPFPPPRLSWSPQPSSWFGTCFWRVSFHDLALSSIRRVEMWVNCRCAPIGFL